MSKRIWREGMVVISNDDDSVLKNPLKIGSIVSKKDMWGRPFFQCKMLVERQGKWVFAFTTDERWLDNYAIEKEVNE